MGGVAEHPSQLSRVERTVVAEVPDWRRNLDGIDPASVDLTSEEWKAFEIVGGELRERDRGWESEAISLEMGAYLRVFIRGKRLGGVTGSNAVYRCFADPSTARKPDVSFVSIDKLPDGPPRGVCREAPDLVVEVISPNESGEETNGKVEDFLAAGTRLIWVIDPANRVALVYCGDGSVSRVTVNGELDGEDVVPGFRVRLADVLNVLN